jgi:AbrB family looped-hinge helix DNA binding protein
MRISEQGQITIPKHLRDRFGMNANVEVEIVLTEQGLLIRRRPAGKHPVERVYGILNGGNTDNYLGEVRGR